jgi:hypothetical protein
MRTAILAHVALILCGSWLAMPIVWGLIGGAIGAIVAKKSPEFQQRVQDFLSERGIPSNAPPSDLATNDKLALRQMTGDFLQKKVHWFWPALCATILVFGSAGLISGLASGNVMTACIFPLFSCVILPPYLKGFVGMSLDHWEKAVILLVQFGASLASAYLGARIRSAAKSNGAHPVHA